MQNRVRLHYSTVLISRYCSYKHRTILPGGCKYKTIMLESSKTILPFSLSSKTRARLSGQEDSFTLKKCKYSGHVYFKQMCTRKILTLASKERLQTIYFSETR